MNFALHPPPSKQASIRLLLAQQAKILGIIFENTV